MAGKRHHTIPRFLLKGFASASRRGEVYTWLHRRGQSGIEVNIKNVSVEQYFYGTPEESDLDERITALENRYQTAVERWRTVDARTQVRDAEAPELIAHLMVRSRQIRCTVSDVMLSMLDGLEKHLTDKELIARIVAVRLRTDRSEKAVFRTALLEMGLSPEHADMVVDRVAASPDLASELARELVKDSAPFVQAMIAPYRAATPDAVRSGHLAWMSKDPSIRERAERYSGLRWFVTTAKKPLLLGDGVCLFELRNASHRFKTFDDPDDGLHRVYLPISSDRVLVGTPYQRCPVVDVDHVNKRLRAAAVNTLSAPAEFPTGTR